MVEDESGALALEGRGFEVPEPFTFFVGSFALDANDNAAVGQNVGERSDLGDELGAPAGEAGHLGDF